MMNPQTKILILFCFLLSINLNAQSYSGADAEQILPGTETVQMGEQSAVPTFVVFKEDEQILTKDFERWERTAFPFSDGITFKTERTVESSTGSHQFRYQYYRDIPVEFALSVVHSKEGKVSYFNGDIHNDLSLNATPGISKAKALQTALAHLNIDQAEWDREFHAAQQKPTPEGLHKQEHLEQTLVVYPHKGMYYLTWKILLSSHHFKADEYIYVDAHRNKVVHTFKAGLECNAGAAVTTWRGTQGIDTDLVGGTFRLHNDCDDHDIRTRVFGTNANFTDGDNFWGNPATLFQAAHSAHFGVTGAWDYFNDTHGQVGLNPDPNDGTVNVFIGTFRGDNNAFYRGNTQNLEFGRGPNLGDPMDDFTTPDICGHEFGHGVFWLTGGATNLGNHQTATLHEGIADIFGNEVETFLDGGGAPDWSIGDERNDGTFRSLNAPNTDVHPVGTGSPDTYFGNLWTNNRPHNDGGVIRFWYFLLSQGGSGTNDNGTFYNVQALGRATAARILYRAIADGSFGTSPSYWTARNATLQAANDIFGACSNQRRQVGNAWRAVGLGDSSLPDLRLTGLTLPNGTSVPEQTSFTVNYNLLTNINSPQITGTYVGFFLRSTCTNSGLTSPFTVQVGGTCYNGTNNITQTINLSSSTPPGTYTLIAKADGLNWIAESNEWNNISCRTITVTVNNNLPDLDPNAPSVNPSSLEAGNSLTASVLLQNIGNATAGSSYMCYYLSTDPYYSSNDTYLGNRYFGSINAGSASSGSRTLTIPSNVAPGNYYIVYRADCYNWRAELNENNNSTFRYITVEAPPSNLPDLVINGVSPGPMTGSPPFVNRGQYFTVNYTLANQQSGTNAGLSHTKIYLSTNNTYGSGDIFVHNAFNQSPGSKSATFQIPYSALSQYYYVLIIADFDDDVTEAYETNNVGNGHLIVSSGLVSNTPSNGVLEVSEDPPISPRLSAQNDQSFEISVFPNPTSDQFTVQYPVQEAQEVAISLYNSAGQNMGNYLLDAARQTGQWQYTGQQLPTGLYYIQWRAGQEMRSTKVVVE